MSTQHPRNIAMGEAFKAIATSLNDESDRGTVVLAVAWLDEALTKILSAYFKPISSRKDNLFSPGQPIGDFGTKISIAERLNLINANLVSSLTICRKLRNDFAHIASDLSLATPSVQDRVFQLFKLNEEIINAMGETLTDSALMNGTDDTGHISIKVMHERFGTKRLFQYVCGFINSGLAGLEYGLQRSNPTYDSNKLDRPIGCLST